ncbi:hypothetical protein [Bacillus thuringiensis]|uniref:hypothetical protein n=1 Tax=Bacillus cereus group TaxID=86661 RepID=UPI00129CA82D|nr:hypothetical protein [Bacillus thuringiensis]HDR5270835.1 hypothetical protein [Bacillus thuringiensis]
MSEKIKLSQLDREQIMENLIKAGAVKRKKPLTQTDSYFSQSIGRKGEKVTKLKF